MINVWLRLPNDRLWKIFFSKYKVRLEATIFLNMADIIKKKKKEGKTEYLGNQ